MTFSKSILKKITTNNTKRPDSPQITISNPLDADTIVNGIELILSPEFTKKGKLLIRINDVAVFDENDSEAFFGYAKYPIPLNKTLIRTNDIQIFAWNGTDSNTIEVSLNFFISENVEPFSSQAVPLEQDVFNAVVSQAEQVIIQDDYSGQTITQLIDMAGYKKMILLISSDIITPTIQAEDPDFTNSANTIDQNLLTKGSCGGERNSVGPSFTIDIGEIRAIEYDFGESVENISVKYEIGKQDLIGVSELNLAIRFYESVDGVIWVEHTEVEYDDVGAAADFTQNLVGINSRYLKVEFDFVAEVITATRYLVIFGLYEAYNTDDFGGSAALSFEVLNNNNNSWHELISASNLGSITQGQSITKQVGDVINDLATDKFNVVLPSTQTDFRAKLIITGNLNVGVSILKV